MRIDFQSMLSQRVFQTLKLKVKISLKKLERQILPSIDLKKSWINFTQWNYFQLNDKNLNNLKLKNLTSRNSKNSNKRKRKGRKERSNRNCSESKKTKRTFKKNCGITRECCKIRKEHCFHRKSRRRSKVKKKLES